VREQLAKQLTVLDELFNDVDQSRHREAWPFQPRD